jgi:ketosteroid isomerase-like protein
MSNTQEIEHLIATYAASINAADTSLAQQIWSDAPEVSFIHPLGVARGRAEIEAGFYRDLMGTVFSERKLAPQDILVHVYDDTAWSEFKWDFVATVTKDGSAFHSQGRETQIYRRENGQWRIVHVNYSAKVITGELQGF